MGSQAENIYQFKGKDSMPSKNGFITVWRDIQKQPWYKSPEHVAIFLHILTSATHQARTIDYRGVSVNLLPGQFITTYKKLAETFGIESESKVRRIISKFINLGQVSKLNLKKSRTDIGLILTIRNWEKWQKSDTPSDTLSDTPKVAYLKGSDGSADNHADTPSDTLNNNDINNKKEYADPEALRIEKINEVRVKGFEHFWKSWREGKKAIGVNQKPPKNETYRKNFLKAFPDSYMKKIGHKGFVKEINDMLDLLNEAFSDIESCQAQGRRSDFENYVTMFPALFLTRKQWREEA